MKKILPIGYEDFKEIIEKDLYYVDKTEVIIDLLNNKNYVSLFSRPRRFGKSLFISMLENFFNIEKKETNNHLFEGLNISKSDYYNQLNSRPVITLNLKTLKQDKFEDMYESFQKLMSDIYKEKSYLLKNLTDSERKQFQQICHMSSNKSNLQQSIKDLSKYLYQYYQKKVIILIDEYDVPIHQGYLKEFYEDIVSFIKEVFSSALKGNEYLEMGIMTGVLRVSKESLFSDLNNVETYGIVDKEYNEYFGFTEKETKKLLQDYDLKLTSDVKNMYDGYNFNGVSIYNPWSIINYADSKELIPYWVNTSGNELIIDTIRKTNDDIKVKIEKLLQGESLEFIYDEKVTFLDYHKLNSLNTIINLFLISGYLTLSEEKEIDLMGNVITKVKLPNYEVRSLFSRILNEELIDHSGITLSMIREFSESLLTNDKEKTEFNLNKILPSMSFMDSTESFYHGYVLGLFSMFLNTYFVVKSNRESGMGRFDLMIEKLDRSIGIMIEFKITKDDMEASAKKALSQMKEKEYYQELVLDKVEKIHEYAIIFKGKKAIVR